MRAVVDFVVVIIGKKFYLDALRKRSLLELAVAGSGCQMQQKVQTAVFAFRLEGRRSLAACEVVQQLVAFGAVIGAHTVDVAFKITVFDEFGECELFKIGNCTGIKAQFFVK